MKTTKYKISSSGFFKHCRMALLADLHSQDSAQIISILQNEKPNYILMAGDMLEPLDGSADAKNKDAFEIFGLCASIAPTFYSTGNHEDGGIHSQSPKWKVGDGKPRIYTDDNIERIKASGVNFLLDSFVFKDGIAFGGLASGLILDNNMPNLEFLHEFAHIDAPKILLCHHPEYYEKYIKELPIDLIVSGHAHGGQWRMFGRGIYAPGQGLFPKYTSGVHDGRFVISRGLNTSCPIPRLFNQREVVIIEF